MEYKMRCNTCGKVYCYNDADLKENSKNGFLTAMSAIGGIASAIGGAPLQTAYLNNQTEAYRDKITDFRKCPHCNSQDVKCVTDAEYERLLQSNNVVATKVEINANATPESLIRRAELFLEDGDWACAGAYADACLDVEPECAYAYVCKLMAELKVKRVEELEYCDVLFSENGNFKKAIRFADEALKETLNRHLASVIARNENKKLDEQYAKALANMKSAKTEEDFVHAAEAFGAILDFKESAKKQTLCYERAKQARKDTIYAEASRKMASESIGAMREAVALFSTVLDWKDSKEQIAECKARIDRKDAEEKAAAKRKKRIMIVAPPIAGLLIAFAVVLFVKIIPDANYNKALGLIEQAAYSDAVLVLENLDGYKDSADLLTECRYQYACDLIEKGEKRPALVQLYRITSYKDAYQLIREISAADRISAGDNTVMLKQDGTLLDTDAGTDYEADFDAAELVAVSARGYGSTTKGLTAGGGVVTNGYTAEWFRDWQNVIAISNGFDHTVGLRSDGTVVAVEGDYTKKHAVVYDWSDVIAISAGGNYTVALKSDGTVAAQGVNESGGCNVSGWRDVVAIDAGTSHTIGLRSDGTVVVSGAGFQQSDVADWTDIIGVAAGNSHIVGLKVDGTVVTAGSCEGLREVAEWTDIVAVFAGSFHTVGLKSDGTIIAAGKYGYGACNVEGWNLYE